VSDRPVIHWFRRDLRLTDNTALQAALKTGAPVIPLFIIDPAILNSPRFGPPRMAFLTLALQSLDETLRMRGSRLMIRQGSPASVLREVAQATGASALFYNRDYTPFAKRRDVQVESNLEIEAHRFDDAVMLPPGAVRKPTGDPYTVYTPFMRRWKSIRKPAMLDDQDGRFYELDDAEWHPESWWDGPLPEASENAAQARLAAFIEQPIYQYAETRNALTPDPFNALDTSCLSPYLRFGLLSPRQVYAAARNAYQKAEEEEERQSVEAWVNELIWREFYMHIMAHFPHVDQHSFRPKYNQLVWNNSPEDFAAWQNGITGYPVVDAAMRQLQAIGWMPNRARMITASFLTKDLLIDWRKGERHFMNWLIDGDPAANNGGWQWTAGTGTDAQPYFRIFNPVEQSKKFDPDGAYIRRWVPELRDVPVKYIHEPWKMNPPPGNYPPPIVDHAVAREATLAAYKKLDRPKGQ
jgi:deoxyribodipyrimidine photo-lyase